MLGDRINGIYADASKIHRVYHSGERYMVLGPHLCSPSPQRTPVLYQAGASPVGQSFAARNAEGTFVLYPTIEGARKGIASTRAVAVANGRRSELALAAAGAPSCYRRGHTATKQTGS